MRVYRIKNPVERLLCKIDINVESGCWEWTAQTNKGGYGSFFLGGAKCLAHRCSYQLLVGPIPDDLPLDHLCRNTRCVNPDHLEPVTCRENLLRSPFTFQGRNAAKTQCVNGHAFDAANTYVTTRGWRACRACTTAAGERYRARRRGAPETQAEADA